MQVAAIFLIALLFINHNTVVYSNIKKCKKSALRYTFVLIPAADDFQTIMKIVGTSRSAVVDRSWKDKDIVEITVDSDDFHQVYQTSKSLKVYSYHSTFCIPPTTKSPVQVSTTPKIVTTKTVNHQTTIFKSVTPKPTPPKNATQKSVTSKNVSQKTTPSKSATQKNTPLKKVIQKNTPSKIVPLNGANKKTEIPKSVTQTSKSINGKITPPKSVTKTTVNSKNVSKNANPKSVTQKSPISKSTVRTTTKIVPTAKKDQSRKQDQKIGKDDKKSQRSLKGKNIRKKRSFHYNENQNNPEFWSDLKNLLYSIYPQVFEKCKWNWNYSFLVTELPVECNRNYPVTTTESVALTPIGQIVPHRPTLPVRHRNWNLHKFFSPGTTVTSTSPGKNSRMEIIKNDGCDKMIDCDADQNEVELVYQQWD